MNQKSRAFLEAYIGALDSLPGWFSPDAAILFIAYNQLVAAGGVRGDVLEIGVYHGKSAVLLGALRGPSRRFVAADLFDSMQSFSATDSESGPGQSGLGQSGLGMKAAFERNMKQFH